jgi:LDH2 family malate/lactate/ureidoglycolate dehydrogenase
MSSEQQKMHRVSASEARSFVEKILVGNGIPQDNAIVVAKCLVEADLRGVDTHGMNRV